MTVRIEKDGPVTTVVLSRPEVRNAVDQETAEALASAFRQFEADSEARVAVLWGEGGNFCSGADLKAVASGHGQRLAPDGDGPMGPTYMKLSKPVIAAVAGHAVAGGFELAIWCDLRVVEEGATFGVFCRRFGVPLVDGGTVRLPRLIGLSRALDLILTGRPVGAGEALEMGLANRMVADGSSREEAEALARSLARFPQVCLSNDRASTYESMSLTMEEGILNELQRGMSTLQSGEGYAGARRFVAGDGRHGSFVDLEELNSTGH